MAPRAMKFKLWLGVLVLALASAIGAEGTAGKVDGKDKPVRGATAAAAEGVLNAAKVLSSADSDDATTKGMPQLLALLTAGAPADAHRDDKGRTALHHAAQRGRADATALLLEHGADVNRPDKNGNTALHEAAIAGHLGVARVLMRSGARPTIRNRVGFSAHDAAMMKGHAAVAAIVPNPAPAPSGSCGAETTALRAEVSKLQEQVERLQRGQVQLAANFGVAVEQLNDVLGHLQEAKGLPANAKHKPEPGAWQRWNTMIANFVGSK
eukprot:g2944.t1